MALFVCIQSRGTTTYSKHGTCFCVRRNTGGVHFGPWPAASGQAVRHWPDLEGVHYFSAAPADNDDSEMKMKLAGIFPEMRFRFPVAQAVDAIT